MENKGKKKTLLIAVATGAGALVALGVAWFAIAGHAQLGPPQNDMAVDKATRNEVIENVIGNLNQHYVFPKKAAAIEKQLRAQMQHGDYDSVTSAEKLAERLTEAVQRDTHDKHLEVRYFEKATPEQPSNSDGSPEEKASELADQQLRNFGFETVGRLKSNIGYIDLHAFGRPQQTVERIAAAMTLLGDTKALIIDLRKCDGGDPETVKLFASYLFDKRTHLNDIYWRDENRTEERWTNDTVPGKKYGETRKVYLLTSEDTFSAGEDFAYALKNNGRATLVGETTGGGAHPGSPRRLSAHFMMFVPNGRSISPVTHADWEGTGVTPDIKVSAKNALNVAQIKILKILIAAEPDPDAIKRMQDRIAVLE